MATDTKLQTPVLVVGTKEQVDSATIGENDLVTVTDEVFYTAKETDEAIEKTMGDVESVLDKISCEPVEKTKFGVSIDNILGDVDESGQYFKPTAESTIDLSGVKEVSADAFYYGLVSLNPTKIIANDLVSVHASGFSNAVANTTSLKEVYFDALTEINNSNSFASMCSFCAGLQVVSFANLQKVSAMNAFSNAFNSFLGVPDDMFPNLEEISGNGAFSGFKKFTAGETVRFSKIIKITGAAANYYAVFGSIYIKDIKWYFPSATEFTGYLWNLGTSYPGEIHFAAANQAAIEACDGYANKWGFAGATIYFDL